MNGGAASAGPEEIARGVERLRAGGLVAFPTETVYGLGANAFDADAVARVFAIKGRPVHNPLIVHVSGVEMARRATTEWPAEADRLARTFWPGPLSLVLPRSPAIPAIVTGGGPNVGVRCPDHPLTLALIEAFGSPLVGPSANRSGRVSPTTADHVRAEFAAEEVLVLDGGPCRAGLESTVLSLVGPPRVLRLGVIGAAEIGRVLGREVSLGEESADRPESPGMLASHYAPRATVRIASAQEIARAAPGGRWAAIMHSADAPAPGAHVERLPDDARGYAAALYAALRRADDAGATLILVERPPAGDPDADLWLAVHDRLARASAPRPPPHTPPVRGESRPSPRGR